MPSSGQQSTTTVGVGVGIVAPPPAAPQLQAASQRPPTPTPKLRGLTYVAESSTRQMDRSMRDNVRRSGKRPCEAYSETVLSVSKKFKESTSQAEIFQVMPTYADVRSQLSRHRKHQCTPVPDPLNIPRGSKNYFQIPITTNNFFCIASREVDY